MPEVSDAELRTLVEYQVIGTPAEIRRKEKSLVSDNGKQRDQIRELKEGQPAEGSVLLSADDGKEYADYKKLGKPSEITTQLEAGVTATQALSSAKDRDSVVGFAKAAGLADVSVDTLLAIPGFKGAKFEVRKQKVKDGKGKETEVNVPYVTLAGEGQKAMKFSDAQEQVPAAKGLQLAGKGTDKPKGTEFVQQGADDKGGGKDGNVYDKIRTEAADEKKAAADKLKTAPSLEARFGMLPSP